MSEFKLYVPTDAFETDDVANKTVGDVLCERAADHYGGFTTYDGRGGWLDGNGNLVSEKVVVLEVVADENADVNLETFGKVNARWIRAATDETVVMFTIDGDKYMVE